ncbi:UDP-N-acetylmuramate--L-alanine ligase [Patescibacteria group bacterium]|nr:UDP-N-acetylmuramate--L-alanine ligase [Patescibacteria group bacterium]
MNINRIHNIHFSGIKGVGMTALALYAQDMGKNITGSDVAEEFVTQKVLQRRNLPISVGLSEDSVPPDTGALVYSAAHPKNPQIRYAEKKSIPVLSYAQALAQLTSEKQIVAVCGVGGKSTTAAMIATILHKARMSPSFVIGVGNISSFGVPGRFVEGKHAVVEADEYVTVPNADMTPKFLYLNPKIIVVTNIEHDHPDVYKNLDETKQAFQRFFRHLPNDGLLVANIDSANVQSALVSLRELRFSAEVVTYGFSPQADWHIEKIVVKDNKTQCTVGFDGVSAELTLSIPGKFNAANAVAAMVVATHLGVAHRVSRQALEQFRGTKRRFQRIGSFKGVEVWDDYAHHPNQIQATLAAARNWFAKRRLVVVFQPHTYSRTKALLEDFAQALSLADEVIVTEIYASAREKKDPSISGSVLAQRTAKHLKSSRYIQKDAVLEYLRSSTKSGDVVMTLGAGDIYKVAEEMVGSG